jgi:hypothetical protein
LGGNFILFSSNRSGNNDIYKANVDGTNVERLTTHGASETFPVWSPDGSRIAFQSNQFGNVDIFVMNADGSNIQRLTVSNAYDGMPSWSPDGSKIVFSSNRNGVYQLWIMNADGSNQRLLNSINPAFFPAWSPDGKAIAFSHDSDLDGFLEIWIVEADGKNPQGFYAEYPGTNRDVWLPTWSPDGKSLGATITSWININGKWYWTGSSFYNIEILFGKAGSVYPLVNDSRVWKAHWASTDTEPPGVCTVTAPLESRWATVNLQLDAQDAQSDILSYEVQARLNGGAWNTFVYDGGASRRIFFQGTDGNMEFRCRAKDWSGNMRDWTDAPIVQTMIDATWPASSISTERLVQGNHVAVNWSGSDKGMGVAGYDIYVKEAGNGNWSLWQENTVNTTAVFTGTVGSTYYFRSQATDGIGHVEVWQPSPEAMVTFYAQVISGTLTDNRGMPIVATPVLTPTGGVDASIGSYRAYTSSALTHTLSLSASGYETFPPTDFSTTSDTQFDVVLGPSTNVLVNGGMESGDLTGWVVSGSGVSAVNTPYSGGYGMQLSGITAVSQTVSVPNTMNQPTLSLMYQLPSDLFSGNLRVQVSGTTTTTVLNTAAAAPSWTHVWADLSAYAGQTITLSVSLDAPTGTAVLDAFSIGPWETPAILSVSPTEVQPGDTITVTGDNFINTPSLFINEIEVGSVQWISSTQLTAVLPNSVDLGTYDVKVINP